MNNDIVYHEMVNCGADGVDFVPIWFDGARTAPIISSFTREEWLKEKGYPKTNRLYWKLNDKGQKVYLKDGGEGSSDPKSSQRMSKDFASAQSNFKTVL